MLLEMCESCPDKGKESERELRPDSVWQLRKRDSNL